MKTKKNGYRRGLLSAALALLALVLSFRGGEPAMAADAPAWSPQSSERLVKLPAPYLEKSLDHDFAASALAEALRDSEDGIALKGGTLRELQDAIAHADGTVRTDLRHRLLAEKQAYVGQMRQRLELERKHLMIRQRVLEQTLTRLEAKDGAVSPARVELIRRQEQARSRLRATLAQTDGALLDAVSARESRYGREYAGNLAAIEALTRAIETHPMSASSDASAGPAPTRQDEVRRLLGDVAGGLAVLEQEETIIGHMARLVALDAQALSAEVMDAELAERAGTTAANAADAVTLFLNR